MILYLRNFCLRCTLLHHFFLGYTKSISSEACAAKFANLEQPDLDPNPLASAHLASGSLEGTGAVGTYFYTAPEIDQGWLHIDEKVCLTLPVSQKGCSQGIYCSCLQESTRRDITSDVSHSLTAQSSLRLPTFKSKLHLHQ